MTDKPKLPEKITNEYLSELLGDKCTAEISAWGQSARMPTSEAFEKIVGLYGTKINAIISYLEKKNMENKPIKWEYKTQNILANELDIRLETFGEDGWELVNLCEIRSRDVVYYTLIFKRPKE